MNIKTTKLTILALGAISYFTNASAELVGVTEGKFEVANGAATYSIPIDIPPGRAGMQPELAINYNSNGGNGTLGVGFSLSGFSAISRCGKTIATDGKKSGVYYDTRDRFCLDGQRLIAVNGTYGDDATEYKTEIDSFAKIISYGSQGGGPQRFKAWTKSGQILEYGNTADSRIEAQGKSAVRIWNINKTKDTVGNEINYSYFEDKQAGEFYPTKISYVGGAIDIIYKDRPDKFSGFQTGGKISASKIVDFISVKSTAGAEVRKYNLTYAPTSLVYDKSKITSVQQCNLGQCLPEVNFKWSTQEDGFQRSTDYETFEGFFTANEHDGGLRAVDINGDGLTDLITASYHISDYGQEAFSRVYLNTGRGFQRSTDYETFEGFFTANEHDGGLRAVDINGDGLTDLITASYHISDYGQGAFSRVYLNTGRGFQRSRSRGQPA